MSLEATEPTNFDQYSREELTSIIESGGQLPVKAESDPNATPAIEEPAADPNAAPAVPDPAAEPEKPADEAEVAEEAKPADDVSIEDRVANFKFTEGADAATRTKEEAEYLELVELTPQVQAMIEDRNARIQALEAITPADTDPIRVEHERAFDDLVSFVKNDAGEFVPNTETLRALIDTRYADVREQLVLDLMKEPSKKYHGYTTYQEFLKDMGGFDDGFMQTLGSLIENGGKLPTPSYTPTGVDPKVSEAYWNSPERDQITEQIQQAQTTIADNYATEEEKAEAKGTIDRINLTLGKIQKGIDAENRDRETAQQETTQLRTRIERAGEDAYVETTLALGSQLRDDIAKGLAGLFDGPAAEIMATSVEQLVTTALAENKYAKAAQTKLAEQGIKLDWAAAGDALNRLYATEQKIEGLKYMRANPRAIENAQREKKTVLLEIKNISKNGVGQILATVTKGAGTALKAKVDNVKKVSAVRPRLQGDGAPAGKPNFDAMPHNVLRDIVNGKVPIESYTS